jgi:hypothetical protein
VFLGIEHVCMPDTCNLTVPQLQASAKLNAWVCRNFGIPVVRSPGAALKPGLKAHNDGLEPGHNTWDPKGHWDGIWQPDTPWTQQYAGLKRSPWTARAYLDSVTSYMPTKPPTGGDVLTDDDAKQLGYSDVGSWRTQEQRAKAVSDVLGGRDKQTGQDQAYYIQYDKTKATLNP